MSHCVRRLMVAAGVVCVVPLFAGCAATQVAIAKRDLDVQTKMSATVFLDPVKEADRTVFVQVRNTSDQQSLDMAPEITMAIANKGYRVVTDPDLAHYMLQANVLQVGKVSPTAAQSALRGGYGGALGAGMGVAAAAYATGHNNSQGLMAAGLLGAIGDTVAGAMVKDVYYSITTDIQIKERAKSGTVVDVKSNHILAQGTSGSSQSTFSEQTDWKTYQTRIVSTANKVNLEFDEASPAIRSGLVRSLAGLF